MATFKNEVTKIKKMSNARGAYVELTIKKDDGSEMQKKVFGPASKDFTVPGLYETVSSKNEKGFWDVDSALLLSEPALTKDEASKIPPLKPLVSIHNSNHKEQSDSTNRAILIQVCIKASADAHQGTIKGPADHNLVLSLAKVLFDWAEKELHPKMEEVGF